MRISKRLAEFAGLKVSEAMKQEPRDPVTGLLNYAGSRVRWQCILGYLRAKGSTNPMLGQYPIVHFLAIDIEAFGAFRREHGDEAADNLERAFALKIRSSFSLRGRALLAHWFPGWFQVILPETSAEECLTLGMQFQSRLRRFLGPEIPAHGNIGYVPMKVNQMSGAYGVLIDPFLAVCYGLSKSRGKGPGRIVPCLRLTSRERLISLQPIKRTAPVEERTSDTVITTS